MGRASEVVARLREGGRWGMRFRQAMAELADCPPQELNRIAANVGLSPTDLRRQACSHPGQSEFLPERLRQLGLDPEFVRHAEPDTYRDLARVCARCTAWRRCRRDLARGDVQAGMSGYCLNAAAIDSLTVECRARR